MAFLKIYFILVIMIFSLLSCSFLIDPVYYEIEISPGRFSTVKISIDNSVKIKFNDQIIVIGKMEQGDAPITIMARDNKLYIVRLFTKITMEKDPREYYRFIFYEQNGDKLKEITASQFPRQIAIANFDSLIWQKEKNKDGKIIKDNLKIERDRDIKSYNFKRSLTAHLWYHLETGEKYYDIVSKNVIEEKFLEEYIKKYQPVMLNFEDPKKISKEHAGF